MIGNEERRRSPEWCRERAGALEPLDEPTQGLEIGTVSIRPDLLPRCDGRDQSSSSRATELLDGSPELRRDATELSHDLLDARVSFAAARLALQTGPCRIPARAADDEARDQRERPCLALDRIHHDRLRHQAATIRAPARASSRTLRATDGVARAAQRHASIPAD